MQILKMFIGEMLISAVDLYILLLFVYVLASFFINNPYAGWYVFLREMCEKPLAFCRRITGGKLVISNFDLSPLLLFFALRVMQTVLTSLFH